MAALFAAILNTRGHFAAPTWTPILNNIVVIATAVLFIVLPSAGTADARPTHHERRRCWCSASAPRSASSCRRSACCRRCAGSASAGSGGSTSASCTCASSAGSAAGCSSTSLVSQVALVVVLIDHGRQPRRRQGRAPGRRDLQQRLPDLHDGARHRRRLDHDGADATAVRRRRRGPVRRPRRAVLAWAPGCPR